MSRDPVCSSEVDELQATTHGLTTDLSGKVYFFCSADCKQRFDSEPSQYESPFAAQQEENEYRSWPVE